MLSQSNKATSTLTWKKKLSKLNKSTPNKNSNRLKTQGNRNIFGVSKVSQTPESKFSIIKIEFPRFVVEDLAS